MVSSAFLNSREKSVYETILNAVSNGKDKIVINGSVDPETLQTIVKLVLGENAQFFFYDNCLIRYGSSGADTILSLSKWVDSSVLNSHREKFEQEVRKIISKTVTDNMNNKQKALALHNYLTKNVRYCEQELISSSYSPIYHTAYGAIVNKLSVCEGISAAYCYLLKKVGIDATIVSGSTDDPADPSHCWNMIKIDSDYFHVDVTWDLKKQIGDGCCFDYFGLKDSDLNGRTWNKRLYPRCFSDSMNYFFLTKTIANTENEFICIAERQLTANKKIYARCPFLKRFRTEKEACDYIFNIITSNQSLLSKVRGGAVCRVNLELTVVSFSLEKN